MNESNVEAEADVVLVYPANTGADIVFTERRLCLTVHCIVLDCRDT